MPSRRTGAVVAALLAGTAAYAQDNSTTTIPAPGIGQYNLPPGNSQTPPAPTPTPVPSAPTPSLTPAPPPSVVPTLQIPTTVPTATPTRAAPAVRSAPVPTSTSTPSTAPTPAPELATTPVPTPTTVASEPTPAAAPVATPSRAPTWLWWAIALGLIAVAALLAWRRFAARRTEVREPESAVPDTAASSVPSPGPPATPLGATAPAPQPDRVLVFDFRPQRLWTRGPDAHLAFELVVTNTGAGAIDAVRPVIVLASAGPDTAAEIAEFQANAQSLPGGEPFALRGGETRSISGELTLPGDAMYVTSAADRELIVPVALVSLHWRAGLALARANEAFVIGTGDATAARLGPIWVDRAGLVYARLDARRFTPGPS